MTGLRQPIVAAIGGRGTWSNWQGRAQAMLGGKPFANLAVTGRDGTFSVDGPLNPGLILTGPMQKLVSPLVQVNLVTTVEERRANLRLKASSGALAIAADGLVDLGQSRFENMKVAARLLQPGAIMPNLRGRDVRVAAVLNGAFATPAVAYDVQAAALGFNETTVEGLRATGRVQVETDRMIVPISARARRITGLNEAGRRLADKRGAGRAVRDQRLQGPVRQSPHPVRSAQRNGGDRRRSGARRISRRAQGRINNYLVQGIGLLDITSNLDVVTQGSGFGISGKVAARTRRIDNASARDFLGGNAVVSANINFSPAGVLRFDNVRLAAPQLRITSGSGTYTLDGRINAQFAGVSTAYGPVAVAVTGTTTAPQIRIRATRPGFGLGLTNVDAQIRATARGYEIRATGQSQYGPFVADVLVKRWAMAIQNRRLTSPASHSRPCRPPAAGPFAGDFR
jgi:translocation and assembly module TamB